MYRPIDSHTYYTYKQLQLLECNKKNVTARINANQNRIVLCNLYNINHLKDELSSFLV